jgi:hypothetical protein
MNLLNFLTRCIFRGHDYNEDYFEIVGMPEAEWSYTCKHCHWRISS